MKIKVAYLKNVPGTVCVLTIITIVADFQQNSCVFIQKNRAFEKFLPRGKYVSTISGEKQRFLPIF